ncbi:hypothetical protein NDU88_001931 [Pleurodeles waltl]|uniref:Uncharacterized protein n=1 Tax=Pleurodeles waltl TaxID=8319 RepID=A0AAV7P5C8_PLEWA|nr:hypothetical protein NDU88_001931 [Pleurodeles waltl]
MQGLPGPESAEWIDALLCCRGKKRRTPTRLKEKRCKVSLINNLYFSKLVLCHCVVFSWNYCVCWYTYFIPSTLKLSLPARAKLPRGAIKDFLYQHLDSVLKLLPFQVVPNPVPGPLKEETGERRTKSTDFRGLRTDAADVYN